jgi:hypothetical protein
VSETNDYASWTRKLISYFCLFFFLPISDLEIERIVSQVQYHSIRSSKIFLFYNLRKFLWIIHKLTKLLSGKRGYFNQSHIAVQPNNSNWLLFVGSEVLRLTYYGVFWHRVLWEYSNTKKKQTTLLKKCIYWSKMQYVWVGCHHQGSREYFWKNLQTIKFRFRVKIK